MADQFKVGVLLSGSGVYDGSEIHEAVFTLLILQKLGVKTHCFAPNVTQHHVINHLTGEEMSEKRNVLIEAARIARGDIQDLAEINIDELHALAMPGGFGAAKNLTKWAFSGPEGAILEEVQQTIQAFHQAKKPIAAICMSPTTVAKALEGTHAHATLTVGTTIEQSPYDIQAISDGMKKVGANPSMKSVKEIEIDEENRIVTSPCYMMEASIVEVYEGIEKTMEALVNLIQEDIPV
ncbi:MAG: isoprenoid biosynthesis glyoxalase ElbB [Thermonemataceae bacterium]